MKSFIIIPISILMTSLSAYAQRIAINETGIHSHQSAVMDIHSATKGLLIPRVANAARLNITDPAIGLWLYDKDQKRMWLNTTAGWEHLTQQENSPWQKNGSSAYYLPGRVTIGASAISSYLLDYQDATSSLVTSIKILNTQPNSTSSIDFYGDGKKYSWAANSASQHLILRDALTGWSPLTFTHEGRLSHGGNNQATERLHAQRNMRSSFANCTDINAPWIVTNQLVAYNLVNIGPHTESIHFELQSKALGNLVHIYSDNQNNGVLEVHNRYPNAPSIRVKPYSGLSIIETMSVYSGNTQLVHSPSTGPGYMRGLFPEGTDMWHAGSSTTNGENGGVYVFSPQYVGWGQMKVDDDGDGVFACNIKNFVMDYPGRSNQEIWYASLEGPEAGAYTRGTASLVNGKAVIPLPDHFSLVANASTLTVIVTPLHESSLGLAVTQKTGDFITVEELGNGRGNYEFDWEVKCVRAGYEDFRVIRPKEDFSKW